MLEAVIGERPPGSWWSHPDGKLVYQLAEAAHDSGQLLALRFVKRSAAEPQGSTRPRTAAIVTSFKKYRRAAQPDLVEPAPV